jgi:hypothetical protein
MTSKHTSIGFLALALTLGITVGLSGCNQAKTFPPATKALPGSEEEIAKTIYPHSADWKSIHGKKYKESGPVCAKCHGADFQGGQSKVSCDTCHKGYPHPDGWAYPVIHGSNFKSMDAQDRGKCLLCHAKDTKADPPTYDCATCHKSFPHPEGWLKQASPNHHKNAYLKGLPQEQGQCFACHMKAEPGRTDPPGMPVFSCTKCHSYFPHPTN